MENQVIDKIKELESVGLINFSVLDSGDASVIKHIVSYASENDIEVEFFNDIERMFENKTKLSEANSYLLQVTLTKNSLEVLHMNIADTKEAIANQELFKFMMNPQNVKTYRFGEKILEGED